MTASLRRQPAPPPGTLGRFASATVGLLGAGGATTLQDHLRTLADLADTDLVLLYHGPGGPQGFELVCAVGVPGDAVAAFGRLGAEDAPHVCGAAEDAPAPALNVLGIQARWAGPLWADGDCVGRLVFGSRRWTAFHATTMALFAATAAQIAVVLQRRLSEEVDAKSAYSPELPASGGAEPMLFRRRRDRFIALLAHELRNPVAPIQSGLDLLATDRLDADGRRDTVRMMQRQLAQLAHLVNDFLDTARLNTGRLGAQRKPVHLLAALATAIETVEPAARGRCQRIARAGWDAAGPLVVDADPVRLTQAFTNLLAAGAAATPWAGTLTVRLEAGADFAVIAFEDEGPALDGDGRDQNLDLLAVAMTGASGAGLGLVRGLLALNDGTVVAGNRIDGNGRVFAVTLPVVQRALDDAVAAPAAPIPRSRRILVVDDNRDAAESLGLLFRLDGHTVRLAHDGPEAVAAAGEFRPEAVVMDLGLPGFSGHEAIMRIRSAPGTVRPAIVALTGWGTRADRDASARAGADLHLVKPVAQAELTLAIERLLQPRPIAAAR